MFPFGGNYNYANHLETTVNLNNQTSPVLIDYAQTNNIDASMSEFRIFGANLGREFYVSKTNFSIILIFFNSVE